jgi:hypothetical protein
MYKNSTPPTADSGIMGKPLRAFDGTKSKKYNRINIKNKASGTAIINLAFCAL